MPQLNHVIEGLFLSAAQKSVIIRQSANVGLRKGRKDSGLSGRLVYLVLHRT